MPALARQGCGHLERRLPGQATAGLYAGDGKHGLGQRPGLVEHDVGCPGECLDCVGPHHEHFVGARARARVIADGTASAKAQGQDTTSTASAAVNARDGSTRLHAAIVTAVSASTRNEARSGALSRASETRPLGLRARDERGDACKCRVLANPIDPQLSRAILDDAAGNQPLAAAPPHRGGFAGQQRLVDAAVRAFEDTVGRHHAAFVDVHPVPDRELVHSHALERAVGAATQRVRWREAGERVGQVARAWCRALISRWRPASRKNTNIDTESKYT